MSNFRFPVSLDLRIDWSELDLYGHINNVSYFKYLQASRLNYWEQLGMDPLNRNAEISPVLASTKCDFKRPLYFPGNIQVRASVTELGNTSFSIFHEIRDNKGILAAEGFDVIVLFNNEKGEKTLIPESMRARIESLEQQVFPRTV